MIPRSGALAVGAAVASIVGVTWPGAAPLAAVLLAGSWLVAVVTLIPSGPVAARWHRARRPGGPDLPEAPTRALAVSCLAGAILVCLRLAPGLATPAGGSDLPAGNGPWHGTVESVGSPSAGQQHAAIRLALDGEPLVQATLPRYPEVAPGMRLTLTGGFRPPPDSAFGTYLRRIGASATIEPFTMSVEGGPSGPGGALESLRRATGEGLARVLPEPEAGLAAGILVGLRDRVDRALAAAFTAAGVSHVVAISGWNIAIVAGVVAALMRHRSRRRRALATAAAVVAYTVFAGASPSVVRAALMAGVVLLARETGRSGNAAAALGWAVAILLVLDPHLVTDPGLELSALATGGLIAWGTPLATRLRDLAPGRIPDWLAESLGVSLAAQAATLPVVLLVFGRLAIVAPVVNLLVVPLVPPAMAAGVAAMVAGWLALAGLPPPLPTLVALPAWLLLALMTAIVEAAAALPFASVTLEPPLTLAAAAASLALVVGMALGLRRRASRVTRTTDPGRSRKVAGRSPEPARARGRGLFRPTALACAAAIVVVALAAASRPAGGARLTVLDVGQGDAILVEGARGGRLLVDGGPDPDRLLVALDTRLPAWDRRLDLVVLTHPHDDHAGGLPILLGRYRIGRIFEPGMRGSGPGYAAFEAALAGDGRRTERLATGDQLTLDDVSLRVLWPDPGAVPTATAETGTGINDVSIVLLGEVAGRRFLLTGDAEEGVDPILVGRGLPRVDVLKVAHHGSRTASSADLLAAIWPSIAVVSVGAGNTYGHPSRFTLGRLESAGARVLRTDQVGSVTIDLDASAVSVRGERATIAASDPLLYHRPDDGSRSNRGGRPAPLPPPARVVPPARARGRRDRGLARAPVGGTGFRGGPPRRRGRGPPPRCRQAAAGERSGGGPAPRARLRGLAHRPRPPRARDGGRCACRRPAPRRHRCPAWAGVRVAGVADRCLRGQARGPATRVDGVAVRVLEASVSGPGTGR